MIWNGLRAALAIFSRKNSLKFGLPERLTTLRESIFTGRANPLRRLRASSPEGGAFNAIASFVLQPETLPPCQRLPSQRELEKPSGFD